MARRQVFTESVVKGNPARAKFAAENIADPQLGDENFDSLLNRGPDFNYKVVEIPIGNCIAFFNKIDISMIDDCVAFSANIDFHLYRALCNAQHGQKDL